MQKCDWFNDDIKKFQSIIASPENFKAIKIENKYKNIISLLSKSNIKFDLKLPNNDINDEIIICSHKYKIHFSDSQHNILKKYFNECFKIYNLCVDIWKDYNEITTNWQLLKDVIFHYLYRDKTKNPNDNMDINKELIIKELKKRQSDYNLQNEENQEKIRKLKEIRREKYNNELKIYKEQLKKNKKAVIKKVLKKPKLEKIKIDKIKNPSKERNKNIKKPAPDDTLKAEIAEFCTNLSNAKNEAFHNKTPYEMKYKDICNKQTITLSNRAITKDGICVRELGKLNCRNYNEILKKYKIEKECKLQYDVFFNKYYLFVVFETKEKIIKDRKEIVACDPGEKIFQTFYSNETMGTLGDNMRIKILKWQKQIKKYQSAIDKNKNKDDKKLKNKKQIRKKIRELYLKIKGFVNEIHKKSAKYLCENYKNIILPEFKTKPMISKNKIKIENEKIKKISIKEEAREEIKKLNKRIRISKNVKFVLNMQSHYRFKKYLKAYAKRYRTQIYDADESYTSMCCTKCGILSSEYNGNREKTCKGCNYKINRDYNGSRNIYLKSIYSMSGMKASLANLF
jgi:putative transposase